MVLLPRTDRVMLRAMLPRIALTVLVFVGLMTLVESLNTSRFVLMNKLGGPLLAGAAIVVPAARASIGTLPITVLLGTIIAVLDLHQRGEFTALKATGLSIWRIMRAPLLAILALAFVISVAGETAAIQASRAMPGRGSGPGGPLWLEQSGPQGNYILYAKTTSQAPLELRGVQIYDIASAGRLRLVAERARLEGDHWLLLNTTRYGFNQAPEVLASLEVGTSTTSGDLQLAVGGARDLTLPELLRVMGNGSASQLQAIVQTSFYRTFALPLTVAGAMLIGFATTARYRRRRDYGTGVIYGLVAGFILFVIGEMAIRAGNAQVLAPPVAAMGPGVLSLLVGLTALLYLEDGRI